MSETMVNELSVNGVKYVRADAVSVPQPCKNYNIVRTATAGVFAGEIVKREGKEVEMRNARRLWYWDGAASLSQLAMEGVASPGNCKFPCVVPSIILTEAIEILPCTDRAKASIEGVPVWKR